MKLRSALIVVTLLGLFAASWFAARSKARLVADSETANRARLTQEAKIQLATERRAAALELRAAAEKNLASLKQTSAPLTTDRSGPTPRRIPTIAERLRTEPDAQVLWLKLQRARATTTYDSLFRNLGLTPEQISRFEDNVIHKQEQQMDLQAIATEEKKSTGNVSTESTEALLRIDPEYRAAQRALLGDAAFQQLQEYERTTSVRTWVDGWAGGASIYIGEPLTPEQGEQLVQIIANANDSYRQGSDAYGRVDWNAVAAIVRPILTPNQFRLITMMEPPLPNGGRFQSELYERVQAASASEAKLTGQR